MCSRLGDVSAIDLKKECISSSVSFGTASSIKFVASAVAAS